MPEKKPDRSDTPFEQWAAKEGIPIVRGYAVEDVYKIPVEPWKRKGGKGALIVLEGGEGFSSAYVCEIPPKTSLKPQRHLFEEKIYILSGRGATTIWNEGGKKHTFEWQEGSLFSPPLNTWHQHFNGSGEEPAKYVAVTDAPLVFNTFGNPDFVFENNFVFKDRFNNETDYFDGVGKISEYMKVQRANWTGGFIPNVLAMEPPTTIEYGKGFGSYQVEISRNRMGSHLARVDSGTYKVPHKHGAGAHLIIIQGTGFALMWEKWDEKVKADFKKGSIYCPPENWWHTHANTGADEVRQIALRSGIPGIGKVYRQRLAVKKGGDMMERADEPPELKQLFEAELAKTGVKSQMHLIK